MLCHLKSHWSKARYFPGSYCKFFHNRVILGSLWQALKQSLVMTWKHSQVKRRNIIMGPSRSGRPIHRDSLGLMWSWIGRSPVGVLGPPISAWRAVSMVPSRRSVHSTLPSWNGSLERRWNCKISLAGGGFGGVKFQYLYPTSEQSWTSVLHTRLLSKALFKRLLFKNKKNFNLCYRKS